MPVGVTLRVLSVSDRDASANSNDNVVLALRLSSDSGDVELASLTLTASGTGDDRTIRNVKVYVDENANGAVDANEPIIAVGTFDQDNGQLSLQVPSPYAIPAGDTDLLVTFDL